MLKLLYLDLKKKREPTMPRRSLKVLRKPEMQM